MASYKVQPGDTLWAIAQKLLGDGSKWSQLGYSGDPNKLPVGTVLNVPTTAAKPAAAKTTSTPTSSGGIVSAQSYYNHNPAGQVASPAPAAQQPVKSVGTAASTSSTTKATSGGGSIPPSLASVIPQPDFSSYTGAPSIPGFNFDWKAAEEEALQKLTPYYQQKLAQAGGDLDLAKRRIEEDYTTGNRIRAEELAAQTSADTLTATGETRDARAALNSRGVLSGEIEAGSGASAAPESGYAQMYTMNPQRETQAARRLAINRAIERQGEAAGTARSRGTEDLNTTFDRYKTDLEEEKKTKAVTQMAPLSYQQAYDKYLATVGRSIG